MGISHNKFGILALMLAAMCWASAPSFAQQHDEHEEVGDHEEEGEHQEGGHESEGDISQHADEIVAEILAQDMLIQHLIDTDLLTQIHRPAYKARDLAEALEKIDQGLAPEDQKKVAAAIRRIGSTAKELDKYGDAEEATKTEITYRVFGAAVRDIKSVYPEVTPTRYWTCSMHPDLWKTESGQCPKCDHEMTLIKKQYEGRAEHHEDE